MTVDYAGDYVEAVEWLEQHLTLEKIQAAMHHGHMIAALAQIQFSLESIDSHKQILNGRLEAIEGFSQAPGLPAKKEADHQHMGGRACLSPHGSLVGPQQVGSHQIAKIIRGVNRF